MRKRKLTLEQAKARYPYRFTCEHVPTWATKPIGDSPHDQTYPAPHFSSDQEWYDNTTFPGEEGPFGHLHGNSGHCETIGETWPLGKSLTKPYQKP